MSTTLILSERIDDEAEEVAPDCQSSPSGSLSWNSALPFLNIFQSSMLPTLPYRLLDDSKENQKLRSAQARRNDSEDVTSTKLGAIQSAYPFAQ